MTSFKASSALQPLDYDLRPYCDAQGSVPEPTDAQVAAFYAGLTRTLQAALGEERTAGVDMTDADAVGRLFLTLDAADHEKTYSAMLDLHADACGGAPSRDELAALPYRVRQAFYGALQGWLRPEASAPATKS